MSTAIVITSGKGGVGKTTSSANIGTALALQGKKVCMVDLDIGLRNLDIVMGLENRIIFDIVDVVGGTCDLSQALVHDKRVPGLALLPAAQHREKFVITPEQSKQVVDELLTLYDFVILDCPAGIDHGFKVAVAGAQQAIVVTTPENTSVRDADRVIGMLESARISSPKLVINRIRPKMVHSGDMLDIDEIVQLLGIDLIGAIPDDEAVISNANKGEPTVLKPDSKAAMAYRNIARRILGDTVPLMNLEEPPTGLWSRMKRIMGGNR